METANIPYKAIDLLKCHESVCKYKVHHNIYKMYEALYHE